jgi:hypothetical protein
MENEMSDDLADLYKERAEYADLESDCQDAKKYVWHGDFLWLFDWIERAAAKTRLFDWIERAAAKTRLQINQEITELKETPHD